jgi:dCMP deaminase
MSDDKWDIRFLELAKFVSDWSKDPSTKTGAAIIRPDRTIASIGFNGFPRGMQDNEELYNNREIKYSRIVHCEMNAILSADESLKGYTLYTYPFASCDRCAVHVIQSGIERVVFPKLPDELKERWEDSLKKTLSYFNEVNLNVNEINFK